MIRLSDMPYGDSTDPMQGSQRTIEDQQISLPFPRPGVIQLRSVRTSSSDKAARG